MLGGASVIGDESADAAEGLAKALEDQYETVPEHRRCKPRKNRDESFPDHWPRCEVIVEPSNDETRCPQHGEWKPLPKELWNKTETMEFEPPKVRVLTRLYPKYVCSDSSCGIVSAERPTDLQCARTPLASRRSAWGSLRCTGFPITRLQHVCPAGGDEADPDLCHGANPAPHRGLVVVDAYAEAAIEATTRRTGCTGWSGTHDGRQARQQSPSEPHFARFRQ